MGKKKFLPKTAITFMGLSPLEKVMVGISRFVAKAFSFWKYARKINRWNMSIADKLFWMYNLKYPAEKGVKCERMPEYFSLNQRPDSFLPDSFISGKSLTLSAAGDIMYNPLIPSSRETLYVDVANELFGADISFANIEGNLSKSLDEGFKFEMDTTNCRLVIRDSEADIVCGYKDRHFTVLSTANSMSYSSGVEGLDDTIAILKEKGIKAIGTNRVADEKDKPAIFEVKGFKIGFIAFTSHACFMDEIPKEARYKLNHVNIDGEKRDLRPLFAQIEQAKRDECDLIVVSLHWGIEHEFFPSRDDVDAAHEIINKGADLILSHHPHVIRPIEYYRPYNKPDRLGVICYSLGNLVGMFSAEFLSLGLIVQLELVKGILPRNSTRETTVIGGVKVIPVIQEIRDDGLIAIQKLEKGMGEKYLHYCNLVLRKADMENSI